MPSAVWPGLTWTACGNGCQRSEVLPQAERARAFQSNVITRTTNGSMRMAISIRRQGPNNEAILARLVLPEGRAEFLMRDSSCSAYFLGQVSQSLFAVGGGKEARPNTVGWIPLHEGATPVWLGAADSLEFRAFDLGSTWGRVGKANRIDLARRPSLFEFETVHAPRAEVNDVEGRDDMVAWAESDQSQRRIMAYSQTTGVVAIAQGIWYPARFAIGEDRYAWLGVTGERVHEGSYETARLYHCKRSPVPEPCLVEEGPALPITGSTSRMVAQGRIIALTGCKDNTCDVYVYDRADSALFRVNRQEPKRFYRVLGATMRELYLQDYESGNEASGLFDGIVRYDLERLEQFATRLD